MERGGYDTVSLVTLIVMAYNLKLKDTPFQGTHTLPLHIAPKISCKADLATVDRVKNMEGWSWY